MAEAVVVQIQQVQQAAWRVARHMPVAHSWVEFWQRPRFRRAAEDFVRIVYALDVKGLSDADLQQVEELVLSGQRLIEVHMTLLAERDELPVFANLVRKLRDAVDGLCQGLPPDPEKRPSDEELMERLARNLREAHAV